MEVNVTNSGQLTLVALLGLSSVAGAAVLKVPQQYSTIQAAIDAAQDGDTVKVAAGTYPETLQIRQKVISLIGAGASQTTIDAGGAARAITMAFTDYILPQPLVIAGFTVRNGKVHDDEDVAPGHGAGLMALASTVVLRDNVFTDNTGCSGMAISIIGSLGATLTRNRIENNRTDGPDCVAGNVVMVLATQEQTLIVQQNVIQNHNASAMFLAPNAAAVVRRNIFRANRPDVGGMLVDYGALFAVGPAITVQDNLFSQNSATGAAGAVLAGSAVVTSGNSFVGNHSVGGASSLRLVTEVPGDQVLKNNLFDESNDSPVVQCDGAIPIGPGNVFASDPEAALVGGCELTD